jgi:hypothetical protein
MREESRQQAAESREQRAESRQQRAESREQRAESREQAAGSRAGRGFYIGVVFQDPGSGSCRILLKLCEIVITNLTLPSVKVCNVLKPCLAVLAVRCALRAVTWLGECY